MGGIHVGRNRADLLDETGWKILEEIQENARISFKEIGNRVGLSCSSVIERVKRMEEEGLIQGYTALLDEEKMGFAIRALIEIKSHSPQDEQQLLEKLPQMAPVRQFWNITGENDFFLETLFPAVKELQEFLILLNEHGQCFTSIVIDRPHRNTLRVPSTT